MRIISASLTLAIAWLSASPALACTLCHSRLADDVRAAVFGPDFWTHAGALMLPLPVLFAAVLLVRRISP